MIIFIDIINESRNQLNTEREEEMKILQLVSSFFGSSNLFFKRKNGFVMLLLWLRGKKILAFKSALFDIELFFFVRWLNSQQWWWIPVFKRKKRLNISSRDISMMITWLKKLNNRIWLSIRHHHLLARYNV